MEIIKKQVEIRILEPAEGKKIKSIINGDIYEGSVYLGKEDSEYNYIEIEKERLISLEGNILKWEKGG